MTQYWVTRLTGAALTAGGIGLATFINFEIPEKTVLHLVVMAVAAIISATGIGVFENARREVPDSRNTTTATNGHLSPSRTPI